MNGYIRDTGGLSKYFFYFSVDGLFAKRRYKFRGRADKNTAREQRFI
jgi:hypothetical protein